MGMEIQILDWIQGLRAPWLDSFMMAVTTLGNAGVIWILLAAVLLIGKKTRPAGLAVAAALILDLILCNGILKPLFARVRPFDVNTAVELLVARPLDFSFPSGHTAAAFAAASALGFAGRRRYCLAALVLAALMAFSRLYLYVHYPTDVLGGILVGLLCGFLGALLSRKGRKVFGEQ